MTNDLGIGVFTAVCDADARWIPQYLREIERLGLKFVVHLDRCGGATTEAMLKHPQCVGCSRHLMRFVEFEERHKQAAFDTLAEAGFRWAMAWDIDETYAFDAPAWLARIAESDADHIDTRWLNLWNDPQLIRVDHPFAQGHRVKFYNLRHRWEFYHPIVNGPRCVTHPDPILAKVPEFVCLHWGMLTHELRVQHKARWDRIYSTALKGDKNPYGFWSHALDPNVTPLTVRHGYFAP